MSFQGVNGGVGYSDPASDADSRRRQMMAQMMMQQVNQPTGAGWAGALNKVLAGALAGYSLNKDAEEQTARGDARNATMADALRAGQGQAAETKQYGDGTTIDWNERKADPKLMASILAGNRDTAPLGMQMQMSQMDTVAKNQAELAQLLFKNNLERENERLKPREIGDGKQWFVPDAPGQTQAPPAPQMAPPAPGGGVDLASAAPNPPPVERRGMSHTPGYVTQVTGIENGTGNPAARNPNSSAMGNGQFIDATWLDIMKRNRPDIVQGKSDRDILALRADPKLSAEMTDVYGMENADFLRAGGIQNVGNAEKYAAHFFGPGGAVKVLQADPNASFSNVLSPEVIRANPQLARMTVGQWRDQNAAKFGGGAQPPAAPQGVQVADASGAIPALSSLSASASVLAPQGPQRVTMGGQSGTVIGGQNGPKYRQMTPDEIKAAGLPPGFIAQIDRNGQIHKVDEGNNGSGAMFPGKTNEAAAYNTYRTLQGKISRGEPLSGDEQFDLRIAQQVLTQPKMVMTDKGLDAVAPPPLPTRNAPQASPALSPAQAASTDTIPNPVLPVAAQPPAPMPQPNQPTVTTIQPKAAKPLPEGIQKGMLENVNAIRKIDDTLTAMTDAPNATGAAVGAVNAVTPNVVTNFFFPKGVTARAMISEISSMKIHDRAGASQTAGEMENLKPFIPKISDSPQEVATKLAAFRREYINMLNDQASAHSVENGFQQNPSVTETIKTGHAPRYKAPDSGDKPATTPRILKFDGEGNIVQ